MRPHTVRRPRLAIGDGAATRVGSRADVLRILAFTRYCYYQYCMWNGKTGEAGGSRILRNMYCNIERGGVAIHEVLNAKNSID